MLNNRKRFIMLISILIITGFLLTSLISFFMSRSSLLNRIQTTELPLTTDNIYSEIQRDLLKPVFISSLMANDTFLRDWIIAGELNEFQIRKYLKEMQDKYSTFTSFFVSEISGNYYHSGGILKKISPDEKRDIWYYRLKSLKADYEINVDPDMANRDTMTIFVNHKVFNYNGKNIGATGVGLNISAVKSLIKKYEDKYNRNIYFTDRNGEIILHALSFKNTSNIKKMEGLSSIAGTILSKELSITTFQRDGKTIHLNSRFIPELSWYLIVEQHEDTITEKIFMTLLGNILICSVITAIVIFLVNFIMKNYQKNIQMYAEEDKKLKLINIGQEEEINNKNEILTKKNTELQMAIDEIKQLSGILPICSSCKKIRDDKGYWNQLEAYFSRYSNTQFSHSICPDCAKKLYPDINIEDDLEKEPDK